MDDELQSFLEDYTAIGTVDELLHWDQETMMPQEGLPLRKAQLSYLSQARQDILISEEFDNALSRFEDEAETDREQAVVRELRRKQERVNNVPRSLTKKLSEAKTETIEIWREARENNEFDDFADALQDMISLKQDYAEHINPDEDPYTVLFRDYEPYIEMSTVENIFDQLTTELPRRLKRVKESSVDIPSPFKGQYDTKTQERVSKAIMSDLGLKPEESRLNLSTHPFTIGGAGFETRITTRINENDLTEAIGSTIHEVGHGLYAVGLDQENWWNPLGWDRDLTIHESQSRFWENHVGHRKSFMGYLLPILNRHFRGDFDDVNVDDAYKAFNKVKEENYIRTEADELTYHLHVALRFELGKQLINGDLRVRDLPEAWNNKMEEYLGITPPSLAKGCLQDIHWAQGGFGYFPTYTLGSMLAAQLNDAVEEDIDVDRAICEGDFDEVLSWQREHIHGEGQRYETKDLIRLSTGKGLDVNAYLDHIDGVLESIYDIRM